MVKGNITGRRKEQEEKVGKTAKDWANIVSPEGSPLFNVTDTKEDTIKTTAKDWANIVSPEEKPIKPAVSGEYLIPNAEGSLTPVSKEEYNAYKGSQGFHVNKGGKMTPAVQQAIQAPSQQEAIRQQQLQGLQLGSLTPEQQDRQLQMGGGITPAVGAGVSAITGAVAGAGTGAAIGSVVPVVGTAVGAVVGAVLGATAAAFGKISVEKKQDVKQAYAVFTTSKSNMDFIINQVNAGKMDPATASEMWDEELANFYAAERNLKADTNTSLERFLSGGSDEMTKLEAYKRRLPFKQQLLQQAILTPNPNMIIMENSYEVTQ